MLNSCLKTRTVRSTAMRVCQNIKKEKSRSQRNALVWHFEDENWNCKTFSFPVDKCLVLANQIEIDPWMSTSLRNYLMTCSVAPESDFQTLKEMESWTFQNLFWNSQTSFVRFVKLLSRLVSHSLFPMTTGTEWLAFVDKLCFWPVSWVLLLSWKFHKNIRLVIYLPFHDDDRWSRNCHS